MPAAFAPIAEILSGVLVEDNHGFCRQRAVFCRAETQQIDARLPGHFRRRAAQRDNGVGKTRLVTSLLAYFQKFRGNTRFIIEATSDEERATWKKTILDGSKNNSQN